MNTQIEALKAEREELRTQLRNEKHPKQWETIAEAMKAKDEQIKHARKLELIEEINAKHARMRANAARVWECEWPAEDITTANGEWHKVKIKKYPKLAALEYAYPFFDSGIMAGVSVNGVRFRLIKYNGTERIETFEEFLKINNIMPAPITFEQYEQINNALQTAEEKLKQAQKEYSDKMQELNVYTLAAYGLTTQCSGGTTYTHEMEIK